MTAVYLVTSRGTGGFANGRTDKSWQSPVIDSTEMFVLLIYTRRRIPGKRPIGHQSRRRIEAMIENTESFPGLLIVPPPALDYRSVS